MKSFIIFICCILSGKAILAQTPSRTARTPKTTTGVTQSPSTTQAATTKPALTTKSTTTQSPVISQAAVTSPVYTKMNIKLPFATAEKEYLVQKMGHFFVLNGDIVVGNDFPKTMAYSTGDRDYRWSNADIPFAIDPGIYANGLYDEVAAAINEFNTKTQLCLTLRTTQEDYIKFVFSPTIPGAGLSSVGRQGGEQHLWLSSTATKGAVIHELMHVAGFYHEQSREDRDQFLRINEANIMEGLINNFQIEDGVPRSAYDYCSIMHYPSDAFSKNKGTTIDCMQNGVVKMCPPCLGTGETFSDADIVGIAGFYNNVSRFPCKQIYKQEYFPYKFPNIYPSASQSAMAAFQHRAKIASLEPFFTGAFPNMHEARKGNNTVGGTIFLNFKAAEWQDVPLKDLGNPPLDDFAARMRATQTYAVQNGYVGGFPNFFHADYGKGVVCGTVLIGYGGAEWRDVRLTELGNPPLDDIRAMMTSANDYAFKNGYLGGFPTFFHTEYGNGIIVCGIVLIKKNAGEWRDVVVIEGPR